MDFQVIIIGGGPGGYVAAIRASQLGLKTALIERESLGGICLNWGCIPTKALLKSAQVFNYIKHSQDYGIEIKEATPKFEKIISRSRGVANNMSKGVDFLMKKNKITIIKGSAKVQSGQKVIVTDETNKTTIYKANHIIIATGARSKVLPNVIQDGKKIIGYREAMSLTKQPETMLIMGSGAIGIEFAFFYNSLGTKVTVVEMLDRILPLEDKDISDQMAKILAKSGIEILTSAKVEKVESKGINCTVIVNKDGKEQIFNPEIVLSAVGIQANIENIGLEEVGIKVENGKIKVDNFYKTNVNGYYAIGDCVPGAALAHVASAEAIICVEKIAGHNPEPLNYGNIPNCTYCEPEVASVGLTETQAKEKGYQIKVGKFPFSALGKANASGIKDGLIKVIFDAKYGEFLGAHLIGQNVTEMIAEVVVARKLETTGHEIIKSVHPHPTLSEGIMEATALAYGEAINI